MNQRQKKNGWLLCAIQNTEVLANLVNLLVGNVPSLLMDAVVNYETYYICKLCSNRLYAVPYHFIMDCPKTCHYVTSYGTTSQINYLLTVSVTLTACARKTYMLCLSAETMQPLEIIRTNCTILYCFQLWELWTSFPKLTNFLNY